MPRDAPKALVLTLYCGEAEYEACKASVTRQVNVETEHVYFEWLPNSEAHEAVYRTIMERSDQFDVFLKLDADMVLVHENAIRDVYEIMLEVPETDHLSMPVYDLPSGTFLMGFHLFSRRAGWTFPLDPLFPDRNPDVPGIQRIDDSLQRRIVDHMPSPSPCQAFALGVHRASKIAQVGRENKLKPADFPLSYLKRVALNNGFDHNLRQLILSGMFETLLAGAQASNYKSSDVNIGSSGLARVLARLYAQHPFTGFIFQILRLRYVYLRRMRVLVAK